MLNSSSSRRLGLILQEADLISAPQIELALHEKSSFQNLKIGEILSLHGWIKQDTADFFAEKWHHLIQQKPRHPLGYYLHQAALLKKEQIEITLREQNQLWLRFGAIIVLKGWLKQSTIDFFLKNLFPLELTSSSFVGRRDRPQPKSDRPTQPKTILKSNLNQEKTTTDEEDIPWIG